QVPLTLHAPERQTTGPVATVQGPSPLAEPQSLSAMSQTPLVQVSAPAPGEHMPFSVSSVWAGSVGTAPPFATFAAQVWVVSSHHWPGQSASWLQPPAGSQVPLTLHA